MSVSSGCELSNARDERSAARATLPITPARNNIFIHRVARWGGEEFLVILDGLDPERAARVLERARADLAARTFRVRETDEPLGQVTISIGAASLVGVAPKAAIEAADARLYAAKRTGRDRLVLPQG